ncbi:MAG TPA: hypothetical protein VKQ72_15035, partial [Aggregatilineales bacterium]|nr:hypothetical protein [Aggregatilineales bacterium]
MSRRYESDRERELDYEDRHRSVRRRERRSEERRIELASFAALIVVFMVGLVTTIPPVWMSLVGGSILLASAIYQSQRRWRVTAMTWIGGIVMLGAALVSLYEKIPLPGGIWL